MGTTGGLVCSTYLFEILPQIPHWEQLTAAILQLSGIGLQSLLWRSAGSDLSPTKVLQELVVVHTGPSLGQAATASLSNCWCATGHMCICRTLCT